MECLYFFDMSTSLEARVEITLASKLVDILKKYRHSIMINI